MRSEPTRCLLQFQSENKDFDIELNSHKLSMRFKKTMLITSLLQNFFIRILNCQCIRYQERRFFKLLPLFGLLGNS